MGNAIEPFVENHDVLKWSLRSKSINVTFECNGSEPPDAQSAFLCTFEMRVHLKIHY